MVRRSCSLLLLSSLLFAGCGGGSTRNPPPAGSGGNGGGGSAGADAGEGGAGGCRLIFEDLDADGFVGTKHCAPDDRPGIAIPLQRDDCDDADPAVFKLAYVDDDDDGFGRGSPKCAGAQAPSGWSFSDDDCNDADAHVHPGAAEQWADSVDSDCDGEDAPFSCISRPTVCGCPALAAAPQTTAVDQDCAVTDLTVLGIEQCFPCDDVGFASVVVANRGTAPASDVWLELESNEQTLPALAVRPLASGAVSLPINVRAPHGRLVVRVRSSTDDCDDGNDQKTLELVHAHCEP